MVWVSGFLFFFEGEGGGSLLMSPSTFLDYLACYVCTKLILCSENVVSC